MRAVWLVSCDCRLVTSVTSYPKLCSFMCYSCRAVYLELEMSETRQLNRVFSQSLFESSGLCTTALLRAEGQALGLPSTAVTWLRRMLPWHIYRYHLRPPYSAILAM